MHEFEIKYIFLFHVCKLELTIGGIMSLDFSDFVYQKEMKIKNSTNHYKLKLYIKLCLCQYFFNTCL